MNKQEEYIAFYKELGLAVAEWAIVENTLAQLVCVCLTASEPDKWMLYQGFYSIENFRSKLQFAETLILEKFGDSPKIGEWVALSERLQRASKARNKLVHRLVVNVPVGGKPGRRFALIPAPKPERDARKKSGGSVYVPPGSICLRDINEIIYEFRAVYVTLANFAARVRGLEEPFPEFAERRQSPSTIHGLNALNHAMLGHPPKPSRRKS